MADAPRRSPCAGVGPALVGEQWAEWQPRTRASATEALASFITIAVEQSAKTPEGLRVYLYTALAPFARSSAGLSEHATAPGRRLLGIASERATKMFWINCNEIVAAKVSWGRVDVTEADISFDEPGEPKTAPRSVPIPPVLVTILQEWIDTNRLTTPERLLFRTRNDNRPSGSNWARAWHRALLSVGQQPMRVYDCRHAAATTWLRAGMPLAETARRLGHSVETLVTTYVGALDDEEHTANQRLDTYLDASAPTSSADA